ncbi:MAG TPA: HAMP domain-containing sensor histidine kinase [Anaerolineales bacterium]
MPHRPPNFTHRPPWWPENEAWPPVRDHLRGNSPFFRRMGCAFAVFNLLGFALLYLVVTWIASLLGGVSRLTPGLPSWVLAVGVGVLIFAALAVPLGILALRRVFSPLDDLLEASGRIADGDYAARVPEKGPREVRSMAKAFNNMASRLYVSDEKRRNLLADVTHELRTPLTVIQGNLEGMLDGVYPADETNLQALLDETNILARLVEDLRTVALAESGALKLKKESTDIGMLVRDTLNAFLSQAEAAGVALIIEMPDGFPTRPEPTSLCQDASPVALLAEIDPGRMRQVLSNLIANALRYTPAGGNVRVKYGLLQDHAQLEVTDDGPGIPPDDLPHIFERFYKSTDSGGMGLGLAIARHLVNAHGGTIQAQNAAGGGTTIRIVLPLE